MRRILVTGASGFVGRHLHPALRAAFPAARLIAATRNNAVPGWCESVCLDLMDAASAVAAVRASQPDAVVHLAARTAVAESFHAPWATWQTNLFGTLALAEAVRTEAPAALFVQASSAEVYGLSFQDGQPLDETAHLRPANPYAVSKAAADLALGEFALRGLHSICLRPFNHTGPGQSAAFVVAGFARQVAAIAAGRQPPLLRVGALDRWRDFLDVSDVCAGYVAVLQAGARLAPGTVFNLASGHPRHIGTTLQDLMRLAGVTAVVEQEATRMRPTDVVRTAGDATAAQAALGWAPRVPWETTLEAVLRDWQARLR